MGVYMYGYTWLENGLWALIVGLKAVCAVWRY
jgi:hypothetical protein